MTKCQLQVNPAVCLRGIGGIDNFSPTLHQRQGEQDEAYASRHTDDEFIIHKS